jgi:hypothetical protein
MELFKLVKVVRAIDNPETVGVQLPAAEQFN